MEIQMSNSTDGPLPSLSPDTEYTGIPRTPLVVILAFLSFGTVLGNSVVCFAIYNHPALRHVTYMSIFSLAIADSLAGLVAMPSYIFKKFTWEEPLQTIVCDIFRSSYFLTGYASILSLSVISVERLIAIKNPLNHVTIVTRRRVFLTLMFVWMDALLVSALPFIPWESNDPYKECNYSPTHWWSIMVIITNVIVPFLVIVICYTSMYLTAQYHIKKISSNKKIIAHNSDRSRKEYKERRANITIMIVIGVFVCCWFPSCFYYFLQKTCPECFSESFRSKQSTVNALVKILTFTSSFVNPLIYCWRSREFRSVFLKICIRKKRSFSDSFSNYINNHISRRGNDDDTRPRCSTAQEIIRIDRIKDSKDSLV
ncbi:histamine H2 receptor-like isoform X1 [Oculina patagonica]